MTFQRSFDGVQTLLHNTWLLKPAALLALVLWFGQSTAVAQVLDEQLRQVPAQTLALEAREAGDAARGAVLFFQPYMACSKCHAVGSAPQNSLGPDLTLLSQEATDEALVESVLLPSKIIRKGFEAVTITTTTGKVLTGLLAERTQEQVVIRDLSRGGEPFSLAVAEIEEYQLNESSLMPAGQMNQLHSRQQFLDLIRYLIEIRDGGATRAMELQPPASLLTFTVPEYEAHLDHAGLIASWDEAALERGEAIYTRVCANCHGTIDKPGSLPTSLRFAEGKFKNGSDPLSMYRTITHGFGLMAPQAWMVPSQKYDVIHYIRQVYLKPHNVTQFVPVDTAYVARLPQGETRGPQPSQIEAWSAMDYGPSLTHTWEIPGTTHNMAYKGIAVRLDPGAGGVSRGRHWMIFDTDTLRMAAGWNGTGDPKDNFVDWKGIQFNGEHGVHPGIVGQTAFVNATGPGWANPATGEFADDQRVLGRDGKRYGPLPRAWGRFKGQYHHGQEVILSYSIGTTDILEAPRLVVREELVVHEQKEQALLLARTFHIGPRERELLLQVAQHPDRQAQPTIVSQSDSSVVLLTSSDSAAQDNPTASSTPDGQASPPPLNGKKQNGKKQNGKTPDGKTEGQAIVAGFAPRQLGLEWQVSAGHLRLRIPAGNSTLRFTIWIPANLTELPPSEEAAFAVRMVDLPLVDAERDLSVLTGGGPPRWSQKLETQVVPGAETGPFAADMLPAPESNPWLALTRFSGLDFFPDGRLAVCTWDGDVWLVETRATSQPDSSALQTLRWQRIASGLFQPLGLKVIDQKIHVLCRDQLAVLHDLNGDAEIDFYECLNHDHQVTEHFHEFAMGLQTDEAGNFYYAKSGCHGKAAVVPHHGTLLRVSPDGSRTDILATGFRAANGVCLNPDGSFVVTDQEGFWNPKNRINWVTVPAEGQPNFYGNMLGYHDVTDTSDSAMAPPLCWITNEFDRSPAELLWVDSDHWGPLKGSLLSLSYGMGKVFLVPHENVRGTMQGGLIELPIPLFPTGVMRGRFHPTDGQLYLCGMFAWAGNATYPGGLYRLRATGQPMHLPVGLHATQAGLQLNFTEPLDPNSLDIKQFRVKTWSLKRTAKYGSEHIDEQDLKVQQASLSAEGTTLTLKIKNLKPTWCMEIRYSLRSASGTPVIGTIHNTIHELAD